VKLPTIRWRLVGAGVLVLLGGGVTWAGFWWHHRYEIADEMLLPIREYTAAEYPEDPGERSVHICQYSGRTLRLIRRDAVHFDSCLSRETATPQRSRFGTLT